jgi:tetratricopeptide (TPR) repeat protein
MVLLTSHQAINDCGDMNLGGFVMKAGLLGVPAMRSPLLGVAALTLLVSAALADGLSDANAGLDALNRGDYSAAVRLFTQAINTGQLSSADKELAYVKRAQAYLGEKNNKLALADLDKAQELDPSDKDVADLRAQAQSSAALASHGKVGLWDITVEMNMPNAMGVQPPNGNTMTSQHCMTAAEVSSDKPPAMTHNKDCSMQNVNVSGGTYAADMVCSGPDMQGNGHVSTAFDSDTHYSGQMTFTGTAHGHPVDMTNSFEGKWVSADCGDVGH